ncbi:MAG: hypothetical protein IJD72_07905 [Alistipes sp.]|nr:hypothetical protein [Alistipes sp.]
MSDDGRPTVIDAERDRVLSAIVMNSASGANFPSSHLILATEGSTSANNGIVLYGRIVKPETLGVDCGDKVEVVLKAGIAVAIKNNGVMYEVTGDAAKQWAEVSVIKRDAGVSVTTITPSQLAGYQGMTVKIERVSPKSEGVWYESVGKGLVEFESSNGEKFVVQVLESAKFASREYHVAEGDICGVVAVDGDKIVLRPRGIEDIAPFDGPATSEPEVNPEEPKEEPEPEEPETPTDPEEPTDPDPEPENPDPEPEDPTEPENPENPTEPETPTDPDPEPEVPETPSEPEKPENPEPEAPTEAISLISELSQLYAGRYYIGGYRDGELYLATGKLTAQSHCITAKYTYSDGNLTAADNQTDNRAVEFVLEKSTEQNGYYIRIPDAGYLVAIGAKAGALRISDTPTNYWLFSKHAEQGFVLRQSGDIDVQIIISPTAKDALLRTIAGDEEGLGVVLLRKN